MDKELAPKPPDLKPVRSALVDVIWFTGSAATAFGVVDLFRTGGLTAMLHMLTTTEGQENFIVAGSIGLVAGRILRRRNS